MDKKLLSHTSIFLANLMYGINYTVAKGVMPNYIQPFGFIVLRVVGALILFGSLHFFVSKEKVEKQDIPRLILCGIFGVALNQLLFFKGLDNTTPINASIIMTTNPILVLIASSIIIKERVTLLKMLGIVFGIAGAIIVIYSNSSGGFGFGSDTAAGDLMIFFNAASYGVYLVLVKPLMAKYNPLTIIKWVFFVGMFIVVPVGFGEVTEIQWNTFTPKIWGGFSFVILGTTFLAYGLNIFGLKNLSPTVVSTYIYLQPILATAFVLMFGAYFGATAPLSITHVLATLLIFTGVYLVSKPKRIKAK